MDGIQSIQQMHLPQPMRSSPSRESTPQAAPLLPTEHEKRALEELQKISTSFYGTRMEFSFKESLGQVVVKIIDQDTDALIKEVPSKEVQELHIRLREMLGRHIDTLI